jgi:lauroyl/myristoyl acyltransferase
MSQRLRQFGRFIVRGMFRCEPGKVRAILQENISEGARAVIMLLILKPAADFLPLRWAYVLGCKLSVVADIAIMHDGQPARTNMKEAFGLSDEEAVQAAREWLTNQFHDYIVLRRIERGREDPTKWRIVQRNAPALTQLQESGKAFILATAQFTRRAHVPFFMTMISPARIVAAVQPLPKGWSPGAIRVRAQVVQARRGFQKARASKIELIVIGQPQTVDLGEYLLHPGNILYVTADAYWPGKRWIYRRPFAGFQSFPFTIGPATLARLTQCPILPCLPFVDCDGTIVLEWGEVIPPPSPFDVQADFRITDKLIDRVEQAVGSRPTQYINTAGRSRRWDGCASRWEEMEANASWNSSVSSASQV